MNRGPELRLYTVASNFKFLVKGFVDDRNRALLPIRSASGLNSVVAKVLAWLDTTFDGHLVFPKELIRRRKLESLVETGTDTQTTMSNVHITAKLGVRMKSPIDAFLLVG